jgi:hypothetical protein
MQINNVWMTLLQIGEFLHNNYPKKEWRCKALAVYCYKFVMGVNQPIINVKIFRNFLRINCVASFYIIKLHVLESQNPCIIVILYGMVLKLACVCVCVNRTLSPKFEIKLHLEARNRTSKCQDGVV